MAQRAVGIDQTLYAIQLAEDDKESKGHNLKSIVHALVTIAKF